MDEKEINDILLKVENSKPFASGNSRKCYNIDGFAVLQERADERGYNRALKYQRASQYFSQRGVYTPEIHSVVFEDGKLTLIEDFMTGSPVYYRDERSYCLERGLCIPKSIAKIDNELRDSFMKSNGIEISDFFSFSKKEKQDFYSSLEKFKEQELEQNSTLREEYEYYISINEQIRQENLSKAQVYAGTDQKFYDKFLQDVITVGRICRSLDGHSDNFLFDENKGFSLIDLDVSIDEDKEPNPMSPDILSFATHLVGSVLSSRSEDDDITNQILDKVQNSARICAINIEESLSKGGLETIPDSIENTTSSFDSPEQ